MALRILLLSLVAGSALSTAPHHVLNPREISESDDDYLLQMCYPNFANTIDGLQDSVEILYDSPRPCEQGTYIQAACGANGTSKIDYLAEQQCLCGSNYMESYRGCMDCYSVHGYGEFTEQRFAEMSSAWKEECSSGPGPVSGFAKLLYDLYMERTTSTSLGRTTTLSGDKFPSQTAVSNYWTGASKAVLGSITGSATARATTWSNYDDSYTLSYTYTTIRPTSESSRAANFGFTFNSTLTITTSSISSPSTTPAPISSTPVAPLSQASTPSSTSTPNGVGLEMGLAWNSGVVLVVVNVAIVALL